MAWSLHLISEMSYSWNRHNKYVQHLNTQIQKFCMEDILILLQFLYALFFTHDNNVLSPIFMIWIFLRHFQNYN